VNKGRPTFTGDYQNQLAEEYKLHKSEYQLKAKELNEAPKVKLNTESALRRYRKLMQKTTEFGQELAKHDVHHILMMVPQSASLPSKIIASNGYGETYYKPLTHKGLNGTQFDSFCRGNELQALLPKPTNAKDMTRDGLRKRVAEMLLEVLSKLKVTEYCRSPELLRPIDSSGTGVPLPQLPRAKHAEVLASRNLKWVAPEAFGNSQGDIIAKLMNYDISHLEDVYQALQNGQLKLVPARRR
jgi:hypothetical protein